MGDVGAGGVVFKNKYDEEQKITKAAGAALATLSELGADSDVNIALMCHSMGNRFLFSFASQQNINPGKKFDQIFMVAADVWEEVFNKGAIEKTYRHNEWEDAGLKVVRMLKEGGKVHCIHYKHDLALKGSVAENWRTRLGSYGIQSQNKRGKVHHECKPFIVDFDMDDNLERESDARGAVSKHCYQATASVIEYYMQHL